MRRAFRQCGIQLSNGIHGSLETVTTGRFLLVVLVPGMHKHSQPKILVGRPLITQQTSCYVRLGTLRSQSKGLRHVRSKESLLVHGVKSVLNGIEL
jgi:hypothetical protein